VRQIADRRVDGDDRAAAYQGPHESSFELTRQL
jgi:hypothetical protein